MALAQPNVAPSLRRDSVAVPQVGELVDKDRLCQLLIDLRWIEQQARMQREALGLEAYPKTWLATSTP
jgi:hypothetical protein